MSFLRGMVGEYSGKESERDRPKGLSLDAIQAIALMLLGMAVAAMLIGRNSGLYLIAFLLLVCVDWNEYKLKSSWQADRKKSLAIAMLITGFVLSFAANNNHWPINFFYVADVEYISFQSLGMALPDWFWIARYGGVVFIVLCEGVGLVYLNRVVTEIRFPNLANSVKAISGKLDDWFAGWGISYSNTQVAPPNTEPPSTLPDTSDAAPWND